jgi:ribosomal protein S18 acetylase RimI-like enzyme
MSIELIAEQVEVKNAPQIPGLIFRKFRGEEDYPKMLAIIEGSKEADGIERSDTLEDLTNNYQHLSNCDPYEDMLFAEVDGQAVAYNRLFWRQEENGPRTYTGFGFLLPDWRRQGIGTAMLCWGEDRLRQIAAQHPQEIEKLFQSWTTEGETGAVALLESHDYQPVRYGFEMIRDLSEPFPEAPMPEGLEVRPVKPEHMRKIWDADIEAFRDHWGFTIPQDEDYERWLNEPLYDPSLFKVAWDGDQVAGTVMNFFNPKENEEYGRLRGYTEDISVGRPWRKRGLAKSLIVQSMQMFKEMGFTETALGVDTENTSGALHLYKSLGYKVIKKSTTYRKEMK